LQDHLPPFQVLEKDEALLASLSDEDRGYLTGINVVQNERVWERFKRDVRPGLKAADYGFLQNKLGRHVPYKMDVDQIVMPYRQPTLILMGRQDNVVGYRDHWQLIENFPRATFAILDKAGHNLQIEQDGLFSALVQEWLERISAEKSSK